MNKQQKLRMGRHPKNISIRLNMPPFPVKLNAMLSKSSWFYFGPGELYGPPFVARCLFYRLHDIDCAILIYHEYNFRAVRADPALMQIKSEYHAAQKIRLHYVNSSTTGLSKLIEAPPVELALTVSPGPQWTFEKAGVTVELFHSPCREMFAAFPSNRQFENRICETPYWVRGPVAVDKLGQNSAKKSEPE